MWLQKFIVDYQIFALSDIRPCLARPIKKPLGTARGNVLPHPKYSSDISPSDEHLFRYMHSIILGESFRSYAEIKNLFDDWIAA